MLYTFLYRAVNLEYFQIKSFFARLLSKNERSLKENDEKILRRKCRILR